MFLVKLYNYELNNKCNPFVQNKFSATIEKRGIELHDKRIEDSNCNLQYRNKSTNVFFFSEIRLCNKSNPTDDEIVRNILKHGCGDIKHERALHAFFPNVNGDIFKKANNIQCFDCDVLDQDSEIKASLIEK